MTATSVSRASKSVHLGQAALTEELRSVRVSKRQDGVRGMKGILADLRVFLTVVVALELALAIVALALASVDNAPVLEARGSKHVAVIPEN